MIDAELIARVEAWISDLNQNRDLRRDISIKQAYDLSADLRALLLAAQGQEWRDGWVNLPELDGHEPDDDLIREIDRALMGPWPNARKMATGAYWAVIYGLQGKGRAGPGRPLPEPPSPQASGE